MEVKIELLYVLKQTEFDDYLLYLSMNSTMANIFVNFLGRPSKTPQKKSPDTPPSTPLSVKKKSSSKSRSKKRNRMVLDDDDDKGSF